MKYLVMECRRSYAVVLDQEGRFLKTVNLGYEVGQELDTVIEFGDNASVRQQGNRKYRALFSAAACLCLILLTSWQMLFASVGTVEMQINPDVKISVNRLDYVVSVKGMNADGNALTEDVSVFGKKVEEMVEELGDKAEKEGYLKEGGQILLIVEGKKEGWKTATEEQLVAELKIHFDGRVTVVTPDGQKEAANEAVIPMPSKDDDEEGDDGKNRPKKPQNGTSPGDPDDDDADDDVDDDDDRTEDSSDDDTDDEGDDDEDDDSPLKN